MVSKFFGIALLSLVSIGCLAGQKVALLALTKDKAVVSIDGQHQLLTVGKTSPEGVTLVEANSRQATISVNGETRTLTLGSGALMYDAAKKSRKIEVVISKDRAGMFSTQAIINGNDTVNALIDTGANTVAISKKMAEKLHLNYSSGRPVAVNTAGGNVMGYEVNINSIKVGAIELHNIGAIVSDTDSMDNFILLGMTFLSHLKMINNPNHLVLEFSGS